MHFPLEIGYGNYKLNGHLFFEVMAFYVGFKYFLHLRSKQADKISESNRIWILIGATFGAFFFSRLVGSLENPVAFYHSTNKFLYFYSCKTILGGLLGGILVVEIVKKKLNEINSSGDLFTFPLILAMIIGRIGCFSSGVYEDTYGDTTDSIFGMDLGDGLNRHPIALYEIIYLLCLALVLKFIERKQTLKDGYRFQLFMIFYLLFRFLIDFIKPSYTFFWEMGTLQICCILGLIYYYKIIGKILFNRKSLFSK
jgi:prolipoprotein diacylglyceryltransferase